MSQQAMFLWRERVVDQNAQLCRFETVEPRSSPLPLAIRHELYENGMDTGAHLHSDFYAFYIVQGGKGIHLIDNHPYPIVRGDVYVLPPGTVHAYKDYQTLEIDACYFQIQLFSEEELAALRVMPGFWHLLINIDAAGNAQEAQRLHLLPEFHRTINEMLAELFSEFACTTCDATLLTRSLFFRMLVHIARWQAQRNKGEEPFRKKLAADVAHNAAPQRPDIATVLHICEERFAEPLSVPQLAALLFLSPSRFSELFSREVGVSPAAYIRRLRLERAQTLLRTSTLSITKIAYQTGFGDVAQLTRAFQAAFHLTPTAYRAQFKDKQAGI